MRWKCILNGDILDEIDEKMEWLDKWLDRLDEWYEKYYNGLIDKLNELTEPLFAKHSKKNFRNKVLDIIHIRKH